MDLENTKLGIDVGIDLRASVQAYETSLIRQALQLSGGNQRRAAELLQLPLRTLERKLRNLHLRESDHRPAEHSLAVLPRSSEVASWTSPRLPT